MEEIRTTSALNNERHTVNQEGILSNPYFQASYFQNNYFQTGQLSVSGSTDATTKNLNNDRFTVRLD